MHPRLSNKILRPDFQGEFTASILAAAASPELISFAGGLPNPVSFPVEEMDKAAHKVLEHNGVMALQYSGTQGYQPLREWVAKRYETMGVSGVQADDIIITNGSQQVLTMMGACMLDPGDKVIVEDPTYLVALQSFHFFDPEILPVAINPDGIDCDALAAAVAANPDVKFAYVIPNFQNPTGRTWDLERRPQFMEIVNRYAIPVIEDNPYGELRFEGEYLPALKSLDTKGLVIYLGTFSKILAPGYRIGRVSAEEHILAKYNFMEQAASLQASTIGQMETSKWIDMFDLDAHVATIRACYDKRRKVMLETLERELPEGCTFTHPVGGLFAWVVLPEYMDAKELQLKCLEKKVAFVPGGSFFPNGNHENTRRLNYSCMPEEKIVQGITALCQTIRENLR